MTPEYAELCFKFPVITQEELQTKWNHPKRIKLDKKREMLICTMISTEEGEFLWHCAIRIVNLHRNSCKDRTLWMAAEKYQVEKWLITELDGVGVDEIIYFESQFAKHASKSLTSEELRKLEKLNPKILQAKILGKGVAPPQPEPETPATEDEVLLEKGEEFDPNWLDKKR